MLIVSHVKELGGLVVEEEVVLLDEADLDVLLSKELVIIDDETVRAEEVTEDVAKEDAVEDSTLDALLVVVEFDELTVEGEACP
ncbi:MAG: hypothetical protein OK457_06765 [Thaumarchaeota archaeon]|nr:hypothetical protein [Nitrososphaerota archaeon]